MTKTTAQSTKTTEGVDRLLEQLAFGSRLHFESGFCEDWNLLTEKSNKAALHVVTQGQLWVAVPGQLEQQFQMVAGDALFLSHGLRHWLSDQPITETTTQNDFDALCIPAHLERGLVCYDIDVGSALTETLFQLMPDVIHLPASRQSTQLSQLIAIVRDEAATQRPGYQVAVSRLSDVIVLHLLRQVLSDETITSGLLAALRDDVLRKVLVAVMTDLAADWSVDSMAALAYLSRSAFADRCQKLLSMSPKAIVDTLRMQRARQLLIHSQQTLDQIAEALGYQSATAFIRFFKQREACAPGEYRNRHA
ncbi:MAG: AraC family transcriptional regulator [Idiomarina sp.]|nr:AraC family transcriptional regulator [Idiomarina sp.]